MRKAIFWAVLSALIFLQSLSKAAAQQIMVKDTVMTTYGFSAPDPVPSTGKIFPYWRFRRFETSSEQRPWKMVVLENPYLRVKIFPQIGGKIWSIFDKTSGKEMFYDNNVVKFRDISLRGPWTSGGIEFNYGVIGHAPSTAHPVDWRTEEKADGSVSCYIGVSELLSRSRWTIEINLPKDAVWVRTSSIWHNGSGEHQPYYSWANSGVTAREDLRLIFPAADAIGHSGEKLSYPINEEGKDLSLIRNQDYGADKSYHMVGSHKSFFGVYYEDEDRGVLHYSLRDEKLGRKYFTWAQSGQGSIWIDLLTDSGKQYVEMQSGRLFNQNAEGSSLNSSYRQFLFTPYGTERWSDYWLPFSGIGAADEVNLRAVTSVQDRHIGIYPLRKLEGDLVIASSNGKVLEKRNVCLNPSEVLRLTVKEAPGSISISGLSLWTREDGKTSRPQERNSSFDPDSSQGRILLARDYVGMRRYGEAEKLVDSVLEKDSACLDALSMKTQLLFRRMSYTEALAVSDLALSIDQYSPEAGYYGGLAALEIGRKTDAMDRLEVAAIPNSELRQACYTELAKVHFQHGDLEMASEYARKALEYNSGNLTAQQLLSLSSEQVTISDPLSHFPSTRKLISGQITPLQFAEEFQEELPWEDYLDLAIFYSRLNLKNEALMILSALPQQNILTALWSAYIKDEPEAIAQAEAKNLEFVFPFRRESHDVLAWAVENGGSWKSRYLLAILLDSFGYRDEAFGLLQDEDTGYAPYYAYRYQFSGSQEDLQKAHLIQPDEWLYRWMLAGKLIQDGQAGDAVTLLERFYSSHPDIMQIGDVLMDAFIALKRYQKAEEIVDRIVYLPFEGMRGSHDKYRRIKLNLALEAIDLGDYLRGEDLVRQALDWPARLGAGKPYDELIDTTVEDRILVEIARRKWSRGPFQSVYSSLKDLISENTNLF